MQKISVIIPTYNRSNTIERAIRSVLEQTYSNLEVIVVDDGSTDNTEEVVKAIHDDRIRYYKKENDGAGAARNEGVKYATAEVIAFHDSDDSWRENKLEKQMRYWEEHPEFSMVYCGYELHREDEDSIKVPYDTVHGKLEGEIFFDLLIRNYIGAPTMLMRKSHFISVGGFDGSLRSLEDWEFVLRFSKQYQIGFVDEILVDAFQLAGSVSANFARYYEVRSKLIADYKEELIQSGLFNEVVGNLFASAEKSGVLEQVKRLLMMYLQT